VVSLNDTVRDGKVKLALRVKDWGKKESDQMSTEYKGTTETVTQKAKCG